MTTKAGDKINYKIGDTSYKGIVEKVNQKTLKVRSGKTTRLIPKRIMEKRTERDLSNRRVNKVYNNKMNPQKSKKLTGDKLKKAKKFMEKQKKEEVKIIVDGKSEIFKVGDKFKFTKGRDSDGWWEILEIVDGKRSKLLRCLAHYEGARGQKSRKITINVDVLNQRPSPYKIVRLD